MLQNSDVSVLTMNKITKRISRNFSPIILIVKKAASHLHILASSWDNKAEHCRLSSTDSTCAKETALCFIFSVSGRGKLELVNSVLLSTTVFFSSTLKMHKGVVKQLDKHRKHCLWRGSDLSSKKPPKAAWTMVSLPKRQVGRNRGCHG